MQSKDIKVGGEYAYFAYPRARGAWLGSNNGRRAVVIESPAKREVLVDLSWQNASASSRIRVPVANLLGTWEEYAESQKRQIEVKNAKAGAMQTKAARIHGIVGDHVFAEVIAPVRAWTGEPNADGAIPRSATISQETLLRLLQAAFDTGANTVDRGVSDD